jgi:UDP-N-acetylglucosamine 2-epimerase (non-hydrolysing)
MQYRDFGLPEEILVPLLESEGDLTSAGSALRWFLRAVFTPVSGFRTKLLSGSDEKNFLVVHGDTLSTLAGAWLAWRARIPLVHIEAGLRSESLLNPFPEEISRRLVSRFADFHMAPDQAAEENLKRAGVSGKILCTKGNTLFDAVLLSAKTSSEPISTPFALVNIHRFENLNSPARWQAVVETVVEASQKIKLIFVQHPQTRHKLEQDPESARQLTAAGVEIRDRMPFSRFIALLKASQYLISDGGSNQEECFYLGKPCLLLRESTERREGLDGCCVLSRFDRDLIAKFILNPQSYSRETAGSSGSPSAGILDALEMGH